MNELHTPQPAAAETESLLTLADYAALVLRFRVWFLAGLVLVLGLTFVSVKFATLKFYKAEGSFFLNTRIPPEQMVGMTDAAIFQPRQNESFQTAVQSQVAKNILESNDLLTSAVARLEAGPQALDLYKLLRIAEQDPARRRHMLLRQLRNDLVQVSLLEATGIVNLAVELPDPQAAARFTNILLELLQASFADLTFGYFIKARELYSADLDRLKTQQQQLAEEYRNFQATRAFDRSETVEQQRNAYEEQLKLFNTQIAALALRVQNLNLATSPEALRAAQPIRIINHAEAPLKKSRPQTIITTAVSGVLYTFVFLAVLMLVGLFSALRRAGLRI